MTFAGRITAGGTAAAVVICLAGALVAGNSVLHYVRRSVAGASRPPRSAPPLSRTTRPQPSPPPAPPAVHASVAGLLSDVRRIMSAQYGPAARRAYGSPISREPVVQLTRVAGGQSWAFGTTVIPVPPGSAAPPSTAFFVAAATGSGTWDVALSGTAGFGRLLAAAAAGKVVTAAEVPVLVKFSAAQAAPPSAAGVPSAAGAPAAAGLRLPWRTGQSWRLMAAFSSAGSPAAWMLTFAGGDGHVRAAGAGWLYRFCGGPGTDALIEVVHPDGTATAYYQMRSETHVADGSFVAAGSYLGMTGTSLACGQTVPGPGKPATNGTAGGVVAFAVLGRGMLGRDGLAIGGWQFHGDAGLDAKPALVWAQHAAARVMLGGMLRNFGAAAAAPPAEGRRAVPSPNPRPDPSPRTSKSSSGRGLTPAERPPGSPPPVPAATTAGRRP